MKALMKENAFVRFIVTSALLYGLLYLIYQFVVKRYTYYDQNFISSIVWVTDLVLKGLGYKTFYTINTHDFQVVGIDGSNGVWVGSNCNAITLFTLFSVFIIAYPGHQKSKLWFIPVGIVAIHILNLVRVISLTLIAYYWPQSLSFNHTYTFTFLVYAFIFLLWVIWVQKFSLKSTGGRS